MVCLFITLWRPWAGSGEESDAAHLAQVTSYTGLRCRHLQNQQDYRAGGIKASGTRSEQEM